MSYIRRGLLVSLLLATAACAGPARLAVEQGMGPTPELPAPRPGLLPTVHVADAMPWPSGAMPVAAPGLAVHAFASGLDHPRWLAVLPNGDVLVAETNGPVRPKDGRGIKGYFFKKYQKKAGAAVPSPDRITLLRDADGDGFAETRSVFLDHLHSPFGMALVGDTLYVADTDALLAFPYRTGDPQITAAPRTVTTLPAGEIDHHWTKNVIAAPDGKTLYVAIGSNSNVGENGIAAEQDRARIWEVDPATGAHRAFATGLRNPVGMGIEPVSGALWTSVNERDELGSDLVPDYMTSVARDGFYGWPFSYYGQHVDSRIKPADRRPDLVSRALVPDYALGPHTASLGLSFATGARLGSGFAWGAFIGQHGSWNRKPRSGYKVIFVPFAAGRPAGPAVDILTGFLSPGGKAMGRPVGVTIDHGGALLVADDVGNVIWRVTAG
jgi:glucose/arabinose dehydrogenase